MTNLITQTVQVELVWNDETGGWELDPMYELPGLRLEGTGAQGQGEYDSDDEQALRRATDAEGVTADDLAHMLRSGLVDPTMNANVPATQRRAGHGMVDMIDGAIETAAPGLADDEVRAVIRALLPIFSSVDANAHGRGRDEMRRELAYGATVRDALSKVLQGRALDEAEGEVRAAIAGVDGAAEKWRRQ